MSVGGSREEAEAEAEERVFGLKRHLAEIRERGGCERSDYVVLRILCCDGCVLAGEVLVGVGVVVVGACSEGRGCLDVDALTRGTEQYICTYVRAQWIVARVARVDCLKTAAQPPSLHHSFYRI
jgi:hypothetical protein